MVLVSVIVPVYKVETYLAECVESILNQTFKDFELILVDDGSPDRCPELCENYAQLDNRVKVIHKKNGGLSSARNAGIRAAGGKYFAFVDSDDSLNDDFLLKLYVAAEEYQADIVCCGIKRMESDRVLVDIPKEKILYCMPDGMNLLVDSSPVGDYYMNKLYRKELFMDFELPEGKIFEDIYSMHILFSRASRILRLNEYLYNYRINQSGISHNKRLNPQYIDFARSCKVQYEFYKKYYPMYAYNSLKKYVNGVLHTADIFTEKGKGRIKETVLQELSNLAGMIEREPGFYELALELLRNSYEIQQLSNGVRSWKKYYNKRKFVVALHNHPGLQKKVTTIFGWNFMPEKC